jgi:hypothetical protein
MPRWRVRDTGSESIEFAVGFSLFALALLVAAVFYQISAARGTVTVAAREAARAASLASEPAEAAAAANRLVRNQLSDGPCVASSIEVATDTDDFHAGGIVAVTVTCRTRRLLGPSRRIVTCADEVIDRYRGGLP